ncbi:ABC transporter membrane fusion protein, PltH-like [Sulfurospirillum multivorans DSM 12446]|uniref:ABC transporter membrane fusion protein, PltH-like n=3 Tax=Sulfurospirillum multivorans TaxID=66821 RepID=A0AA86AN96_SULMK|nr:ABC transporter membrane fusion protein, PltH-like [Sulfurospirillum multivorans DSM 12446]QEH06076.1 ABC transporter membrane fusion protein, PltH-like [Sulfurospirillum multivorans]
MKFKTFVVLIVLGLAFSGFTFFDKQEKPIFSGQIETKDSYLGSKTGGRVEKILKQEGDVVKLGEEIIAFDSKEQHLKVELYKAKLEQAKVNVLKMKTGYQKEDIAIAKADVNTKNAALENARKNYERYEKLLKDKATTPQEYEERKNIFLQAKAQFEASQKKFELYTNGYRVEDISMANEVLNEAQANYALALLELDEAKIVATSTGKIEKISVRMGDLVSKNQPIIQVSEESQKYAKFYIPETKLHMVSVGQKVEIKIDGSDKKYGGEVYFIAQNAEFTPKNISTKDERQNLLFAIKAKVNDEVLKSGLFVEVTLP